jgi:hypothetical protein
MGGLMGRKPPLAGEPTLINILTETLLDENGSTVIGSPSMSCGKTDNWTNLDMCPTDYKVFFIGIMLAVRFIASADHT